MEFPPIMYEYLLWNNCNNGCKFCWQKHINNPNCFLTDEEKCESINKLSNLIQKHKNCDLLIVGGEVFEYQNYTLYKKLYGLFDDLHKKVTYDKIRFLYVNTNLLFQILDLPSTLVGLFNSNDLLDRLKFTTSYDIFGRFNSDFEEKLFLKNLHILTYSYPKLNVVVNTILTKQFCESDFNVKKFSNNYRVNINLIPYITLHEEMRPSIKQVYQKLCEVDNQIPGYVNSYIQNLNFKQEKKLYEYNKIDGYVYMSSKNSDCGHNENFKKVFNNNECFICQLNSWFS